MPPQEDVHVGIMCDGCSANPMSGARFKCVRCPDYDLCGECFAEGTPHPHGFVRVEMPKRPFVHSRMDATNATPTHVGVICDECGGHIKGTRYKCGHCSNFDLCATCEEKTAHDVTHVFVKIRIPLAWSPIRPLLPALYKSPTSVLPLRSEERGHSGPKLHPCLTKEAVSNVESTSEHDTSAAVAGSSMKRNEESSPDVSFEARDLSHNAPTNDGPVVSIQETNDPTKTGEDTGFASEEGEYKNDEPIFSAIQEKDATDCDSSESFSTVEDSNCGDSDESHAITLRDYAYRDVGADPVVLTLQPKQRFEQSWKVENIGMCPWPIGSYLHLVKGPRNIVRCPTQIMGTVQPNEIVTIKATLRAPKRTGVYYSSFCIRTPNHVAKGRRLFCIFTVVKSSKLSRAPRFEPAELTNSEEDTTSSGSSVSINSSSSTSSSAEDRYTVEFPSPACSWPASERSESESEKDIEIVSVSSRSNVAVPVVQPDTDNRDDTRQNHGKHEKWEADKMNANLSILEEMGFTDRGKNKQLLMDLDNRLPLVIQLLLEC